MIKVEKEDRFRKVKKFVVVWVVGLVLLFSLSPIAFASTYWERDHRSGWLLGCDKLDARVRIYAYGSDVNFNFTLTEKTSSEWFGVKVVNNHCYGWNGSEWLHLTNAPNGVGNGIIEVNTWYELKISCDNGYGFSDVFVELVEYHSQQNLGWFYVNWHDGDELNLDDEFEFDFNYVSGDLAVDRFAVNTGQKWLGNSVTEWQECFLSDEFSNFESWNIDANYTMLEHGVEVASGCILLYMGADAPESPSQTSAVSWWEQMYIGLWASFQSAWYGVQSTLEGIPIFGDFIKSAWGWLATGSSLLMPLWGLVLQIVPILPYLLLFWVFDVVGSCILTGDIKPLGVCFSTILHLATSVVNVVVTIVGMIWSFIRFW